MNSYVLGLEEINRTMSVLAGGKGANLGELSGINGIRVPPGFCVTTAAYRKIIDNHRELVGALNLLGRLEAGERSGISGASREIRAIIESISIPGDVETEIASFLIRLGEDEPYAVRSSATAEDLPTASFAGQQDSFLNVIGKAAILKHISKCMASLFTERAVTYRLRNGFDHRQVHLAVIVQKMVFPQVSGVLFTADPISGSRKVSTIDASFGLGEALVSGLVNADHYKVHGEQVIEKKIGTKKIAIEPMREGGTQKQEINLIRQNQQALTDQQLVELERTGRAIESHFGCPQDIEWCWADDAFYVVQSRPITTLFPVPEVPGVEDHDYHVYVSVGHQQMMTDAMKPLGLSIWQITAARPMCQAGGRLFVDITQLLASPAGRNTLINTLGDSDPLIKDALTTILSRRDFVEPPPTNVKVTSPTGFRTQIESDPAIAVAQIERSQASLAELKQTIQLKSGPDVFDFILEDIAQLRKTLAEPQHRALIMAPMDAAAWINEKMKEWLGEKNAADTLSQSLSNNVTSEMGLALLEVADVIRPYPEVIALLQGATDDQFMEKLAQVLGGREAQEAIQAFLDKYGMRCVGEIDITKPRWVERPQTLIPLILGNVRNCEPGAGKRRFEKGLEEAKKKERELIERLKGLPDGEQKAEETKRMIDLIRTFSGFREYPKYHIVSRYFVYKQALLKEAERLVHAGALPAKEDIDYLSFEELHSVVSTRQLDTAIIRQRKEAYRTYEKLSPPRVMTSDGEIFNGLYRRDDLPAGAIAGLPVSSGVIEGRARVITNLEAADLEEGDILVTAFTDPSWTPLFISIKGLVTEVGGLMTHGSVIAREYGLPAVVGIDRATELIQDGRRIRVNGTEGYVELL